MKIAIALLMLLFILGCASPEEKGRCLKWTTTEVVDKHCTRPPYMVCIDEVKLVPTCLAREEED